MARPTKQGIDYFPLDVQFDDKTELYLLEKESIGLSVLITLWQLIYQNNGYYISNSKDLLLLVKKRINVELNEIDSCIKLLISREIFDASLYKKFNILTSKAIQKRFFDAAQRKKIVYYDKRYIINGINVSDNSIDVIQLSPNVDVEGDVEVKENVNTKTPDKIMVGERELVIKDYFINLLPIDAEQSFIITWCEWVDFRKEIKKKLTTSTAIKQIEFLLKQSNPIKCINQSIQNGWQGLFEDKNTIIKTKEVPNQNFTSPIMKELYGK